MTIRYRIGVFALALCPALGLPAFASDGNDFPGVAGGFHSGTNHNAQGYLGINMRDVSEENVSVLHLREARGAEIIQVDHDGPAGKMGLREHDVVLQMNGVAIEGEEPMRRMLRECPPGRTVTLVISRDGQQMTMNAVMADRAVVERQAWQQHVGATDVQAPDSALPTGDVATGGGNSAPMPTSKYSKGFLGTILMTPSYTGLTLELMAPQLREFFGIPSGSGLLVQSVASNSPAAMAGIHAGDIVVRANAQPMPTMSKWTKVIKEAKGTPVSVVVMRDHQEKTLTLLPDSKKRSALDFPAEPYAPAGETYIVRAVPRPEF